MWEKCREINTIKIMIATFISVGCYRLFQTKIDHSLLMITLVNAIFGIRPKTVDAWIFFRFRLLGTIIGCLLGSGYLLLVSHIQMTDNLLLLFVPIFTYVTVVLSGGEKAPITVRGGVMTLITMILVVQPMSDKYYVYHRIIATFLGLLISVAVNWMIAPGDVHVIEDLEESIEVEKGK